MPNTNELTTSTLLLSLAAFNLTVASPKSTAREIARAAEAADLLDSVLTDRAAAGDAEAAEHLGLC